MQYQLKLIFIFLLVGFFSLSFSLKNDRYIQTEYGPAIEWAPSVKLEWNDFKANEKTTPGFAVATSTCGFGLESETKNGNTSHKVYVRFYCDESWHNSDVKIEAVLAHEQLHFDICEIYGRKLFKELLKLKKSGKLNAEKAEDIYNNMMKSYNEYQDLYDKETDHSTNGKKQQEWNEKVKREMNSLAAYSDYQSF
jgi:polyhydroxyalkanoate synthesis regulator phasin